MWEGKLSKYHISGKAVLVPDHRAESRAERALLQTPVAQACMLIYGAINSHEREPRVSIPPATADRSEGLNYNIVMHITPHIMIVDI